MSRLIAALAVASLLSCAAERKARAPEVDPTNPSAPVPAAAVAADPLAPVKLVPEDEEEDEKKSPHEHHHHRDVGSSR